MDTWTDLHRDRWGWVDRPIAAFREACDPSLELHHHLDNSESEYNAVLFGRTQTGKTTLMLRLLGLTDAGFGHVAGILRGGRPVGHSATAAPTRYQWSSDADLWQYRIVEPATLTHAPQDLSDEQVAARLADLRDINGAPVRIGGVVEIGIPRRYRRSEDSAAFARVLDLPGAAADTESERALAEDLIRRHVPAAHLVIMVVRADAMVQELGSGLAAEMPQLAMWTDVPERFRIVFTRAYSCDSVRRRLGSDPDFRTAEAVREHLLCELGTTDLPLPTDPDRRRRITEVFHPLEYGDSWETLRKQHPDTFTIAERIVQGELARLSHCLVGTAAEDMRRIGLVRAAATVQTVAERRIAARRDDVSAAEACRAQDWAALAGLRDKHAQAQRRLQTTERQIAALQGLKNPVPSVAAPARDLGTGEETRRQGRNMARDLPAAWRQSWSDWVGSDHVRMLTAEMPAPTAPHYSASPFVDAWGCKRDCKEKCSSRRRHRPWRNSPDYCGDKQIEAKKAAEGDYARLTSEAVDAWAVKVRDALDANRAKHCGLCRTFAAAIEEAEGRLAEQEAALAAAKQTLSDTEDRGRDAIERSMHLTDDLSRSLRAEIERLDELGRAAPTNDGRLAHGLAIALAMHHAERLSITRSTPDR